MKVSSALPTTEKNSLQPLLVKYLATCISVNKK